MALAFLKSFPKPEKMMIGVSAVVNKTIASANPSVCSAKAMLGLEIQAVTKSKS